METVDVFAAKSRLSEILAAAEYGKEFTVTRHGQPIARIVPYRQAPNAETVARARATIARLRAARDAAPVDDFDWREAIDEGRD